MVGALELIVWVVLETRVPLFWFQKGTLIRRTTYIIIEPL